MANITATERNNVAAAINRARAKWGLGSNAGNVGAGTVATAGDYNNLVNLTNQAKSKSGYGGGVEGGISVGTKMIQSKLTNLASQANAIYNYCKCHGNCSGGCTGSCSGSCSGRCTRECRNSGCSKTQPGH